MKFEECKLIVKLFDVIENAHTSEYPHFLTSHIIKMKIYDLLIKLTNYKSNHILLLDSKVYSSIMVSIVNVNIHSTYRV